MGSCMSSNSTSDDDTPAVELRTAKLVNMDGSIQEFTESVKYQDIIGKYPGHFVRNSGGLYAGRHISEVLHKHDQLEVGELYFLLPKRKLQFVLTDSDMASLLVKANTAIEERRKISKGKVQPLFDVSPYGKDLSLSVCRVSKPAVKATPNTKKEKQWKLETIVEGS